VLTRSAREETVLTRLHLSIIFEVLGPWVSILGLIEDMLSPL